MIRVVADRPPVRRGDLLAEHWGPGSFTLWLVDSCDKSQNDASVWFVGLRRTNDNWLCTLFLSPKYASGWSVVSAARK